jgi:hypothetical protein
MRIDSASEEPSFSRFFCPPQHTYRARKLKSEYIWIRVISESSGFAGHRLARNHCRSSAAGVLLDFAEHYPEVDLELTTGTTCELVEGVLAHRLRRVRLRPSQPSRIGRPPIAHPLGTGRTWETSGDVEDVLS